MNVLSIKLGLSAVLSLFMIALTASSVIAQASANVFAVTSTNQLVRFNTASPGTVVTVGPITGLQGGESVLGIDFRPATGELYALGSTSRIYVVNKTTASATQVAVLSTTLTGTAFGFDFNPTVDRIRIVSNTGQNLRINPTNGVAIVDGPINGPTAGVDEAGYTNSFSGATTTTLYDISSTTDTLYTQNPPNNGTLNTVGALGVNVSDIGGLDIVSTDNTAFAVLTTAVVPLTGLYTINLTTGSATLVGLIGNGLTNYSGFAVEIGTKANYLVYGVTTSNNLVRFNSSRPNTMLANSAITGLQGGENILGIDFRPASGELFALGSTSRIYRLDTASGAATQVGTAGAFSLSGTNFGFDFNPVPDRIRVTSDNDQNLRLNPNDGTLSATDGTLAFIAGDANAGQNPNIVGSAYTNSFGGSTTTTLYDIDSNLDILAIQNPPNNGTLNTVGPLGINVTGEAGFDIAASGNIALAAFQIGAGASSLYSVDLSSGAASPIGPVGGLTLRDIAIGRSTAAGAATVTADFDGDGRTDYSVFRLASSTWFINRSSNNSFFSTAFGVNSTDILTPGDYDGDGRTDIAVWRTTTGTFFVLRSSDGGVTQFQWGSPGDEPLPRDYDGDGKTDFAVARQQGGVLVWYIFNSSNGSIRIEQFGFSTDFAAPGDYDGDGRFDLAVHRGTPGDPATFFVQGSTAGTSVTQWGLGGDLVVPGDYDGDGKTDFAVVRAGSQFTWYVLRSSDLELSAVEFGAKPHFTTQGDYDGDGKTDFSVWDPLNGVFYVLRSGAPGTTVQYAFGQNGDYPVVNYDTH